MKLSHLTDRRTDRDRILEARIRPIVEIAGMEAFVAELHDAVEGLYGPQKLNRKDSRFVAHAKRRAKVS